MDLFLIISARAKKVWTSSRPYLALLNTQTENGTLFILMAKSCCGDFAEMFEGLQGRDHHVNPEFLMTCD